MVSWSQRVCCFIAVTIGCAASTAASAQIVVGQTVGLTGAVEATVKEAVGGARLYIDAVNQRGGVRGQKIELVTLDDKFDPALAVANARSLILERNATVLFMNRGTPHTEAIMPLLREHGIALVGPSTGASLLHNPVHPYIFNVRSSYQREAEKAVDHLATTGITRIATVHVDDSFGRDGLAGVSKGLAAAKLQPVVVLTADRNKPDYAQIVPALLKTNAQAIVWIGSGTAVADGIKALRAAGSAAQIVTLSNNASSGFIKLLGSASRGVIVTQVFPYERAIKYRFVKEVQEAAKSAGMEAISPAVLEGYAAAKVLVEALRRAGPSPSRASVVAALNNMQRFDLGGLEISYSPSNHTGLDFADLSIIGNDGKFQR